MSNITHKSPTCSVKQMETTAHTKSQRETEDTTEPTFKRYGII